jgi:F-box protein 9
MDPSGATMRYTFQMILELRSRPLGRWNRLDFVTYDSVSMESGEATPLALKNDRPFWFSKVRSYA